MSFSDRGNFESKEKENRIDVTHVFSTYYDSKNKNKIKGLEIQQHTNEVERSRMEKEKGFKDLFKNFGQNTSIHGLRLITEEDVKLKKRSIWFILLLTCAGVLVWQIVDRFMYFYDRPINVIVQLKYNKTLEFPLVTICNQNAFKATIAARESKYKLLEKMFTSEGVFDNSSLDEFDASNISLFELYNKTAHNKEDFIFRCSFKGIRCKPEDFTRVITDHGVCYTFDHRNTDRQISSPGVENGLRLTLNVEQYEYMPGPHDSAGVKMFLHDPGEIPRVHSFGQAIPSGAHVVVGVKVLMVKNLNPPYGKCEDKELYFADKYSFEACELDCLTKFVERKCRCREPHMPDRNGYPPVCTLIQYYQCLKLEKEEFISIKDEQCKCPIQCNMKRYEPDISYASTSQYAINKLLTPLDIISLNTSLIHAKETSSKLDASIFQITKRLAQRLHVTFHNIDSLMHVNISQLIQDLIGRIKNMTTTIEQAYKDKERLYRYQIRMVDMNFIRYKDAKEERILHNVYNGYLEHLITIQNRIRMLANGTIKESFERYIVYILAKEKLKVKQIIIQQANKQISRFIKVYRKAKSYSFDEEDRKFNEAATPKHLIKNAFTRNNGKRIGKHLKTLLDKIDCLSEHLSISYNNNTLDEDRVINCSDSFKKEMEYFLSGKSTFYHDTVEWPKKHLEERHAAFKLQWNNFSDISKNVLQILKDLMRQIIHFGKDLMSLLEDINSNFNDYVHGDSFHKYELSKMITSSSIQVGIVELRTFFQQLSVRESDILDWIKRMQREVKGILKDVYHDEDAMAYYSAKNWTKYLRNSRSVMEEVNSDFKEIKELSRFKDVLNNREVEFMEAFEEVVLDCKNFLTSVDINSAFIRRLSCFEKPGHCKLDMV